LPDMLVDSYILPECIARPGSFGGLMALYEANFIKLNQLVSNLGDCAEIQLSGVPADSDLHLQIEKRSKYTCEIRLSYLFAEGEIFIADPDLVARVYFDARMVEVKGWINSHRHELLRTLKRQHRRELGDCWSRNIMFSKWLDYLLEQGHAFPSAAALSA